VGEEEQSAAVDEIAAQGTEALPPHTPSNLEWESVADEVTAAIAEKIEPLLKKSADEIYERLLWETKDYLTDNLKFNIGSQIDTANQQALYDRQRAIKAEKSNAELLVLLRALRPFAAAYGMFRFSPPDIYWDDETGTVEFAVDHSEGRFSYGRLTEDDFRRAALAIEAIRSSAEQVVGSSSRDASKSDQEAT
jgi:hypothetical protein